MKRLIRNSIMAVMAVAAPLNADETLSREIQPEQVTKLRMMSNNNLPKKVIVVRNYSTSGFVDKLVRTIQSINKDFANPMKLHVIVDSSSSYRSFKKQMEDAGLYGSLVEINEQFFTSDQWMQDWGEILVAEVSGKPEPELTIFDSNRGRGLRGLPKLFADMWGAHYLKNPNNQGIKGDYGGNIEVSPDNVLVIGDTSTQDLRQFFAQRGYADKTALLETRWLTVGHVDEYVSFVPDASAPGGYAIVKADPGLAIELIKNASPEQLNAIHSSYRSQIINMHNSLKEEGVSRMGLDDYDLSEGNILTELVARNSDPLRMNQLVDLNRSISELIDRNIETLKQSITAATKGRRTEFRVVSFPTIFQGRKSGGGLSGCVALLPGTVNMLVLGQHAVIPDAQFPLFNDHIRQTTASTKIVPHFLENLAYHYSNGQIHCGTNVMRETEGYAVKPEVIMRKPLKSVENFQRLFQNR